MYFHFRKIILLSFIVLSNYIFSQENFVVSEIKIVGNKVTKDFIIKRELLFKIGDSIPVNAIKNIIEKSKQNLINTSLFNFVYIDYIASDRNMSIEINVDERWYLWPYIIFEHADRNLSNWINEKNYDMINYGFYFVKYNFRGRKEQLKIKFRRGYKEQYAIQYYVPFIEKSLKAGLNFSISYFKQKELNYSTFNNKLLFISDKSKYLKSSVNSSLSLNFRPKHFNYHIFSIAANLFNVNDTIIKLNNMYLFNKNDRFNYYSLGYSYIYDNRNSKTFPTTGYYASANIFSNTNLNDYYNANLIISLKSYFQLNNRFSFQNNIKYKNSVFNHYSYIHYEALGYSNNIRGFEYYVVDGKEYVLNKSSVDFNILPYKELNLNFLPLNKFNKLHFSSYFSLFFDCGFVNDIYKFEFENNYSNQFLYSYGLGLNIITYYDKVFKIEYSINKFNFKGFYIQFNTVL